MDSGSAVAIALFGDEQVTWVVPRESHPPGVLRVTDFDVAPGRHVFEPYVYVASGGGFQTTVGPIRLEVRELLGASAP